MKILTDRIVTARKSHVCFLCCEMIEAGRRYRIATFADAGRAWSTKEHLGCAEIMQSMDYDSDMGYGEGKLLEQLAEYTDDDIDTLVTDVDEQQRLIALRNSIMEG